ncbi:MAG: Metal-dependent protein hydrolase [Parcubacteria group bacterium GW2011_GWC1_44_26]|nr:MAG: Metal-dependent protein hydrolase [Parcubacteria group bacterium GW2011_GWC1_44_26]
MKFAVLSLLNDGNIEVIRSRDSEVWATGDYVVDVGGEYDSARGRFDHHQEGGAGVRPNGIPYSSFGLVWKEFGENLCGNREAARRIDEKMVQPIDAADCGIDSFILTGKNIFPYLFHHLVASFRPTWKEELNHSTTYDEGFARAFDIATEVLKREIITAQDYEEGARVAEDAYQKAEDKRVVIVDGQYPWEEVLNKHPEPIFVVKPDKTEPRWKVRTVRLHHESFKARKDFPKAWAGKNGEEFARVTGVPDAIFCHNSGTYIVVAGSKEGALALAKLAVDA